LIFKQGDETTDLSYWLASSCVYPSFGNGYAFFGVQCIFNESVRMYDTIYSDGGPSGVFQYYGLRPVVSLKSNVQIGEKEGEIWTLK